MSAPELSDVKWKELKIATISKTANELFGFEPKSSLIREAFDEVVSELEGRGVELAFSCGYCNSPIDEQSPKCWACGSVIEDEFEEPEMSMDALVERATKLGIDVDGKSPEELAGLIEVVERKKREMKRNDFGGVESEHLNEKLTEMMGDGWRKKRTSQYTTYWDPGGTRRIAVFHRGLSVHFSVDDGTLNGFPKVDFYDAAERKRRHYGRTNYAYVGDVAKEAIEACAFVFERYGV